MQPATDSNRVFMNPQGFVEAILVGDQTDMTFRHVYDQAEPLLDQLRQDGKPVLGLIDMSRETGYSLASDKAALDILENAAYDKLAMCNAPHSGVVQGIILAMGRESTTKLFPSRDEALAWLLAG